MNLYYAAENELLPWNEAKVRERFKGKEFVGVIDVVAVNKDRIRTFRVEFVKKTGNFAINSTAFIADCDYVNEAPTLLEVGVAVREAVHADERYLDDN